MDWKETLKEKHPDDLCMRAIMLHFVENGYGVSSKLHKDDLARVPLKAWKHRKNDWERFSIDTVLRKARKLAELGLLEKDNLGSHGSTRYWVKDASTGQIQPSKPYLQVIPKRQMLIDGEWKWVERPDLIEV